MAFGIGDNRIIYKMISCNIINNSQTDSNYGLIDAWEETTIENSCILNNSGNPIIWAEDIRKTTLTNCSIDFGSSTSGSVSIKNRPAKSFTNALIHFSTFRCSDSYQKIATKKPRYKICFKIPGNQRKQGDIIYLPEICFFLVNFIQADQKFGRIAETNKSNIIT